MQDEQRTSEQVPETVEVLLDQLARLDEAGADHAQVDRVVRLLRLVEDLRRADELQVVAPRTAPGSAWTARS